MNHKSNVDKPCSNCGKMELECACMRNKCIECGNPVGNITFSVCGDCWNKRTANNKKADKEAELIQAKIELANLCKKLLIVRKDEQSNDKLSYRSLVFDEVDKQIISSLNKIKQLEKEII